MSPAQSLIAAMLTPALLILAAGSLIAAALIRLGRVVDRVRALALPGARPVTASELERHERRARLALAAMTAYFVAIAAFVGAGIGIAIDHAAQERLPWLPVSLTLLGMALIVAGVAAMVRETQLSAALVASDITTLRARLGEGLAEG